MSWLVLALAVDGRQARTTAARARNEISPPTVLLRAKSTRTEQHVTPRFEAAARSVRERQDLAHARQLEHALDLGRRSPSDSQAPSVVSRSSAGLDEQPDPCRVHELELIEVQHDACCVVGLGAADLLIDQAG